MPRLRARNPDAFTSVDLATAGPRYRCSPALADPPARLLPNAIDPTGSRTTSRRLPLGIQLHTAGIRVSFRQSTLSAAPRAT
jgi:hypothetical protein